MSVPPAEQAERHVRWEQRRRDARRLSAAWLLDGRGFGLLGFGVDLLMLALTVVAAIAGAAAANVSREGEAAVFVFPVLVLLLLYLRGMYSRSMRVSVLDGVVPVVSAVSIAAMTCVAGAVFIDPDVQPTPLIARAWLFGLIYVGAGRVLLAASQRRARSRGLLWRPALIVGAGRIGAHVARRLEEHPEYGLRPIGFLDADPPPDLDVVDRRAPVLGGPDDLAQVAAETGAQHVILAFVHASDHALVPMVRRCDDLGLEVSLVPRLYEAINDRVALEHLGAMPLLGLRAVDPQGWQFAIKHAMDRVAAVIMLVMLAPLLAAISAGVKRSSPGPVLFRQRRVGRDGQVFDLVKFRSMRQPASEKDGFRPAPGTAPGGVEGEDRRTPFGRFIRRTSLDELPQLINVVRGEMSLVGPRPERPEFVSLFRDDVDRYGDRHRVKSGISGWAQVHGYRGQTSLADRVEWDNYYIENWSLWLDVKIMLLTVLAVLRSRDE